MVGDYLSVDYYNVSKIGSNTEVAITHLLEYITELRSDASHYLKSVNHTILFKSHTTNTGGKNLTFVSQIHLKGYKL
jgi:hypothetical protein